MYLSGIVVTLVGVYLSDGAEIKEKGFFFGYTYYVWFVIFLASVGGLYTSIVVKYTDNIMKGFSAAAAIVLSTIASVTLFGLQISASWFARFWQGERLTSLLHLLLNVAGAYSVHSDGLALLSLILAVQQFPSVWNVAFTGLR